MNDEIKVEWDISPDDVGRCDEYDGYIIRSINVHEDTKKIWSVNYTYSWHCGDYCCSDTEYDTAYSGDLAPWLKERILKHLPGYTFENT